jgi:mono/diheme cytochrome c family protein/glucose/arabinose dehydrogenase
VPAGVLLLSLFFGAAPPAPTSAPLPEGTTSFAGASASSSFPAGGEKGAHSFVRASGVPRYDGEAIYNAKCATCHQQDGAGLSGVFPPLVGTDWVTGDEGLLIRILLHGVRGGMEVNGNAYSGAMPPWQDALSDEEIAQVATYVRTSWGNRASEVSTGAVARIRKATSGRSDPWTAEALRAAVETEEKQAAETQDPIEEADVPGAVESETTDRDPVDEEAGAEEGGEEKAPPPTTEADFYQRASLPMPEDIKLEVGGLAKTPGGQMAVATRRGDVWLVENPSMQGGEVRPRYTRFAQGLHEPLGLAYHDGAFYAAQRTELTRLRDPDGDNRADRYETVTRWPVSGNYHEYAFGPRFRPGSDTMVIALNAAWMDGMQSPVPWRGWIMEVTTEGEMIPLAPGMRSPAGLAFTPEGALLYSENQGGWVGSGRITRIERGDFAGHPASLRWTGRPGAPLSLKPEDVPNTGRPMHEVAEDEDLASLKLPTVWLPHGVMGISTSDMLPDTTGGAFGPFGGQLFVGDQGSSKIVRVFLEKVDGTYQGAAFPFREGFSSGVVRLAWGGDGALYAGMTARGWASAGDEPFGLQRLTWTGRRPFEIEEMRARSDGFELTFTQPVAPDSASDPSSYDLSSFTYKYHATYGSPPIDRKEGRIEDVQVAPDSMSARLRIEGLRRHYIHELKMPGVRSADGAPLLHPTAYYTLHNRPDTAGEDTAGAGRGSGNPSSGAAPTGTEAPSGDPDG